MYTDRPVCVRGSAQLPIQLQIEHERAFMLARELPSSRRAGFAGEDCDRARVGVLRLDGIAMEREESGVGASHDYTARWRKCSKPLQGDDAPRSMYPRTRSTSWIAARR